MSSMGFGIAILAALGAAFLKFGLKNKTQSPGLIRILLFITGVGFAFGLVGKGVFYAEPGYVYHVRTVTGQEAVVYDPGYKFIPLAATTRGSGR